MMESATDLTVDELAARAGVTVRTIRFYSTRGLLPPPEIGPRRVGRYGPDHLSRLALIEELQHQGHDALRDRTLSGAAAAGSERPGSGHPPGPGGAWIPDKAEDATRDQLERRVGRALTEEDLDRLAAMSVLVRTDDPQVFRVDPGLLHLGVRLLDVPIALETILAARTVVIEHTRSAARELSRLFKDEVWDPTGSGGPDEDEMARMKSLSAHMQPMVVQALVTAFQRSMKQELRESFGKEGDRNQGDQTSQG